MVAAIALVFHVFAIVFACVSAGTPSTAMCRNHPGTGFNKTNVFLNKQALSDESAKCNDGSQAQLYFRPCCSGDDPGDFCNASRATWLVVFGDGNQDGWCWDIESCARRALEKPQLTSSKGLAQYFGHDGDMNGQAVGAFAKGGEINPNFYKSYVAYIPSCSSDLFLGECTLTDVEDATRNGLPLFCGKSVAMAAVHALVAQMAKYGADDVVLVGGAGVMNYIDKLRAAMPTNAKVSAICDGCVLFDDLPPPRDAPKTCSDAFSCTPERTLPAATRFWNAHLSSDCGGWRCLLSTLEQGKNGAVARAAQTLPLLAQHPLYDELAFSARGLAPLDNATFAASVRDHIKSGLAHASVVVAGACTFPQSSFTKSEFFTVRFGGFNIPPPTYATGLDVLVTGFGSASFEDSCQGVDCNADCKRHSQGVVFT